MFKNKLIIFLFCATFLTSFSYGQTQKEAYSNDFLYSQEYFDYLIEQSQEELLEELENKKEEEISFQKEEDILFEQNDTFKLKIEETSIIDKYEEKYKTESSKAIIPINSKLSFIQDTLKIRNKYFSNDQRILAGIEYSPFKALNLATGFETTFRGLDQNPNSRKAYLTPTLKINDVFSISFYNKYNLISKDTDHDIGVNISPFKSKIMDFRLYTGLTRYQAGNTSESISFTTNLYFK